MFNPTTALVLGLYSTCALALDAPHKGSYAHEASDVRAAADIHTHPHVKPRRHGARETTCAPYWMENIKHQGVASFNPNPRNYTVFRNVKSYGAVGDGVTDDTAAIQRAITEGNRCAPGFCASSTNTPAVLYFPGGTYLISSSIIDYYYTQIIGNPNCLPTILAASNFSATGGIGLIDASPYLPEGIRANRTGFGETNTFFRQIRNLILDTTRLPIKFQAFGVHWPTAQATTIQNVLFNMNAENGTEHQGMLVEGGSGGFMADLVFNGGNIGINVGNQQFTMRNLTFNNMDTAIQFIWNWGWSFKSVFVNNCRLAMNASAGGPSAVNVGSVTLFDSEIKNTQIGIATARTHNSQPPAAGALYLENVKLQDVGAAVVGPNGTYLAGSSGPTVIDAWADGHRYLPEGPINARGRISPTKRPADLVDAEGNFYQRSKPQYGEVPLSQFLSARSLGVTGDGHTDDTAALNAALLKAKSEGKILYLDAGFYKVTSTVYIPPGSIIVGEALGSVILSSGPYFNSVTQPQPVVKVALPGEQGRVEMSDIILSTQGEQAGAILMEYNLGTYDEEPSGFWDVHVRIGGFYGSDLQTPQCEKTENVTITETNLDRDCIAAYLSWHVTKYGAGLYMESNWVWTADHDLDEEDAGNTQLTIYSGRGLLVESVNGRMWLYGTAVEHHVLYQYQFVDTRNVYMGQIQTETAYYQPNPNATIPFPVNPSLHDPVFASSPPSPTPTVISLIPVLFPNSTASNTNSSSSNSTTTPSSPSIASGWGLRIIRSNGILGYSLGLYSFFNNYNTTCNARDATTKCQVNILSIEGDRNSYDINLYNVNTVGSQEMITRDGVGIASYLENNSSFVNTINVFRIGEFGL